MPDNETWRPVPGFPGYEASTEGRVRSLLGRAPRIMSPGLHRSDGRGKHGTNYVRLNYSLRRDNRGVTIHAHTVILLTFVGPRPEGHEARHLNGDALDNRLANLLWGTKSENALDTVRHGNHNKQKAVA